MNAPCPACLAGPSGINGHDDLRVQTLGDGRLTSQCLRCGTLWARGIARAGAYTWVGIAKRAAFRAGLGINVPPRSTAGHAPRLFGDDLRSAAAPPRRGPALPKPGRFRLH